MGPYDTIAGAGPRPCTACPGQCRGAPCANRLISLSPRMSEQLLLMDWLTRFAARLRRRQVLHVLAWGSCGLLTVALLWQGILALVPVTAVALALLPLLLLAAAVVLVAALWSLRQPPSLAQAAFAADQLGGWHDLLKSALDFAQLPRRDAAVATLMMRTEATVSAAPPAAMVSLRVPPMGYAALLLGLCYLVMVWWSPRWQSTAEASVGGYAATRAGTAVGAVQGKGEKSQRSGDTAAGETRQAAVIKAAQGTIASAAAESGADGTEQGSGTRAQEAAQPAGSPARDAGGAPSTQTATRAAAKPPPETSSEWLGSVVERLKEMLAKGDLDSQGDGASPPGQGQGAARVDPSDRGNQQDQGSSDPATTMRNADNTGGSQLNLNALGGIGPRNTLPGDVAGEEQSGRNNHSNSGPLGRRVSSSRAGAGDGDDEVKGDPGGNAQSPAVLGTKTVRLALQLRKVPSPAGTAQEPAGAEPAANDAFFAATRAQAARTAVAGAGPAVAAGATDALSTEQTPLAYRSAVKDYFLRQHSKEK